MQRAAAVLLGVLSLTIFSVVHAQVVDPGPISGSWAARQAADKALKDWDFRPTAAEIQMATGGGVGTWSKVAVKIGKAMPFIGFGFMAYEIYEIAAEAFLNAGHTTGTSLDTWVAPGAAVLSNQRLLYGGSPGGYCEMRYAGSSFYAARTTVQNWGECETWHTNVVVPSVNYAWNERGTSNPLNRAGPVTYETVAANERNAYGVLASGGGGGQPLYDFLQVNPDAYNGLADSVMPWYEDTKQAEPSYPSTYANPYPNVQYGPTPNINQWHDNPYANPAIDTDGDTWADWLEFRLGTNPNDAASYPCAACDADGDGYTNDQERVAGTDPVNPDSSPAVGTDTDADGVADSADPCPADPLNACVDGGLADQLQKFFDGVAQEATLQQQLEQATRTTTAVESIEDLLREDASGVTAVFPTTTFQAPDLSTLTAWSPDVTEARAVLDAAVVNVTAEFDQVFTAADGKFPFGMGSILNLPTASVGSACASVQLSVMQQTDIYDLCTSPLDNFMVNTMRPILVALLTFGMLWLVMMWVRQA